MSDNEKYFTKVVSGNLAVRTVAETGDIIPEEKKDPKRYVTALVQTDDGPQLAVKTFSVGGGGGGGGSDNYNDLSNKPKINSVTLSGNKTSSQLGLQSVIDSTHKLDVSLVDGAAKETAIVTLTTASTELASNTIYNGGELASVTLTLPATVTADFIAQVEFTSGTTPTTFTAPSSIYFNGDGCEDGEFTPAASHRYCMLIISDGTNVLAFVYEK